MNQWAYKIRLMPFEYYQFNLINNLGCLERIAGPLQGYRRFFFKYSKTIFKKLFLKIRI